jgi:hypothetical protein
VSAARAKERGGDGRWQFGDGGAFVSFPREGGQEAENPRKRYRHVDES